MKIYISGLPLTLGVILHIHVSRSMESPPVNGQLPYYHPRAPPAGLVKLPAYSEHAPEFFFDNLDNLHKLRYANNVYTIAQIATRRVAQRDVPDGYYLHRKGHSEAIGEFKGHKLITQRGCSPLCKNGPRKNDFVSSTLKPFGYYGAGGVLYEFLF